MRRFLLALVVLCLSTAVFGQKVDKYGIPNNSLTVQVSDSFVESVAGVLVGALVLGIEAVASHGEKVDQIAGWIPYITASYDYHFADTRFTVGPEIGYWHIGLKSDDGRYQHFNMFTGTMNGKIYYKPAGICKLYGGLNAGLAALAVTGGEVSFFPAVQLNPIGMQLGKGRVAFVAELGLGYRGILQLGANIAL
jgi:hypothetical protein